MWVCWKHSVSLSLDSFCLFSGLLNISSTVVILRTSQTLTHSLNSASRLVLLLLFVFWPHIQHAGSYFPNPRLNPCPPHWEHGILTTGPPGKSLCLLFCLIEFSLSNPRWGERLLISDFKIYERISTIEDLPCIGRTDCFHCWINKLYQ